ncbi:MAG: hypothetical protein AMJ65_05770 [Phycisphaerae bacterium SG8_4]|nr:MAG: hypothetical protein AMJ65_05770 [Phycisphaerae bacterium SG8_4]
MVKYGVLTNKRPSAIVGTEDKLKKQRKFQVGYAMKYFRRTLVLIGLLALLPVSVQACSTPVFRYALERWPADFYDGVLVHRGPIAEDHPAARLFEGETAEFLNLRLSRMDLDSAAEEDVKKLLGDKVPEKLPALVLWYPWQKGRAAPFWMGEFTPETVAVLIQSATRKEVAKRLTEGQAAVWIFVESGDKAKDKAALELLNKELETVAKELMEFAPPVEELDMPSVSFEFSTVSLSRTDPNERALLSMIMHSEPDLDDYVKEPMAVPVFGRGRALYTLIGEGINADNIREASAFLTGPCGCEIKMMNPGVDLMMAVDWDGSVMQMYEEFYASAEEEELPELTSVFPDDPEPVQVELDVTAQVAESDSPDDPPAAAQEAGEAEPVMLEESFTDPIAIPARRESKSSAGGGFRYLDF